MKDVNFVKGATLSTNMFYEGQARRDGAIFEYSEDEKNDYLKRCHEHGVVNMEMEGAALAAFCNHVGVPFAMACSVMINRLEGDQVKHTAAEMGKFSLLSQDLVVAYCLRTAKIDE